MMKGIKRKIADYLNSRFNVPVFISRWGKGGFKSPTWDELSKEDRTISRKFIRTYIKEINENEKGLATRLKSLDPHKYRWVCQSFAEADMIGDLNEQDRKDFLAYTAGQLCQEICGGGKTKRKINYERISGEYTDRFNNKPWFNVVCFNIIYFLDLVA